MFGKKKQPNPFFEDGPEQDEEPEEPPVWPDALEELLTAYSPATDGAGNDRYTDTLTSDEIVNTLVAHCGQAPTKAKLVGLLREKGYSYKLMNGTRFHWMLKKE